MPILSSQKSTLAVLCVVLVVAAGCSEAHPLHPTYEELTQRGFYVYILSESEIEKHEWSQTVSIWSWDRHCKGGISGGSNPIHISYDGQQEQPGLLLVIGPWNTLWDYRKLTTKAELDTPWAMDSVGEYYTIDGYSRLKFEDRFGITVQVGSCLPITEVVRLVNQLEYIGPPPETVTNPWDYSKCSGQ